MPLYVEPRSNGGGGGGGGAGTSLSTSTLAQASALPVSDFPGGQHTVVWVDETQSEYNYVSGSVAVSDGWSVLNVAGGRLILRNSKVTLSPLGGGLDDRPRFISGAVSSLAGIASVSMCSGQWLFQTPGAPIPSRSYIEADLGVQITSTIPVTGGFFDVVFGANTAALQTGALVSTPNRIALSNVSSFGTAPPAITISGAVATPKISGVFVRATLGGARGAWTGEWSIDGVHWTAFLSAAAVVLAGTGLTLNIADTAANANNLWFAQGPKSLLVTLATPPTVGNSIELQHAASSGVYHILAVLNTGTNYTIVIDRPLVWPFVAGDLAIEGQPITHDIELNMRGATVGGTGNQTVEFARILRPMIRDFHQAVINGVINPTFIGYDIGCREGLIEQCSSDITGSEGLGYPSFYMQSGEQVTFRALRAKGGDYGIQAIDSIGSIEDCEAYSCAVGFFINTLAVLAAGSFGSLNFTIASSQAIGCNEGLKVLGAKDSTVSGFSAIASTTTGIVVDVGAVVATVLPENNVFVSCSAIGGNAGILVNAGTGTKFFGLDISGNVGTAATLNAECSITGLTARSLPTPAQIAILCQGVSNKRITNADIALTGGGGAYAINVQSGTVYLENVIAQGAGATGLFVANGATAVIGPGCDFSGCDVPVLIAGGGVFKDRTSHAPVYLKLAADVAAPAAFGNLLSVVVPVKYAPNNIQITFYCGVSIAAAANYAQFRVLLDGVDIGATSCGATGLPQSPAITLVIPAVTPGNHTVTVQWTSPNAATVIRAASQPDYEGATLIAQEVASA